MEKTTVYNFIVFYEKDASLGIDYLKNDLDYEETRVFFDQARARNSAQFEDDDDRQYTLLYKNGVYTLIRR